MAAATLISVEQYLGTSYRPDRDYVDGKLRRRNLGEGWHAAVQMNLGILFGQHRHDWRLRPLTEQRVQVLPTRFRVPDLCLVEASEPITRILRKPPVLCVEVLSSEDRFSRILERVEEYLQMGVPHVWIIDPRSRDIWTLQNKRPVLHPGGPLTLTGTSVSIQPHEIFALIDEAPPGPED